MGKQNTIWPLILIAVFVVVGLIAASYAGLFQLFSAAEEEVGVPEGNVITTAKWNIFVKDFLNEGAAVTDGTIELYDPADPGVIMGAGAALAVASGKATTTAQFTSGQNLFVRYKPGSWFDYGIEITIPKVTAEYDTIETLDLPNIVFLVKPATVYNGTTVFVNLNGNEIWKGYNSSTEDSAYVDAINPQTAAVDSICSVRVYNNNSDCAIMDWRSYTDYGYDATQQQARSNFVVINFELTGSSNAMTSVSDYLRFKNLGGARKIEYTTSVALFYEVTNPVTAMANDDDSAGNTVAGRTGSGEPFVFQFDFSGAISKTDWTDEIDVEVSFFSSFAIQYFINQESFIQAGDYPLGEESGTVWTKDLSMG